MNNETDTLRIAFDEGRINRMTYDLLNERFAGSEAEGSPGATANARSAESVWQLPPQLKAVPWWGWLVLVVGVMVIFKPKFITRYL